MNNLAQAPFGGTWVFAALGIASGLVALAAWATHCIWFVRSFGWFPAFTSFGKDMVRKNGLRYFLGMLGLMVPIIGIIHGFAIWAGAGARARN